MDSSEAVYKGIKNAGINFIVSVPCVNLKKLLNLIDDDDEIIHIPVTREEEGIGICSGAYMGGKKVAILMQNSGLGNSINAIASLGQLYNFPMVMIISHRGVNGEPMIGQIPMGKATNKLLESLNIPYYAPKEKEEAYEIVSNSWKLANSEKNIVSYIGILLDKNYW